MTRHQAHTIIQSWQRGFDTYAIAKHEGIPEYVVAKVIGDWMDWKARARA